MGSGGKKKHEAFKISAAPANKPMPAVHAEQNGAGTEICPISEEPVTNCQGHDEHSPTDNPIPAEDLIDEPADNPNDTPNVGGAATSGNLWERDSVITPIPDELDVGNPVGTALAVGGADIDDGSVTLMSYRDGDSSREVMLCTLSEEGEDKLLDALSSPDAPMIPVEVEKHVTGRLDLDKEHHLAEDLITVAKSINHHSDDTLPQHTLDRIAQLRTTIDQFNNGHVSDTETAMLNHYDTALQACEAAAKKEHPGKVDKVTEFEAAGVVTVTEMVPDPEHNPVGIVAKQQQLSRIDATLLNGESRWDGDSRDGGAGTELAIDIGDGYTAIYRPTTLNPPGSSEVSMHRHLEVIAPPGAGHQHELVDKLADLNLTNRPMSHTEAEFTALRRNVAAHGVEQHPAVTDALAKGEWMVDAAEQHLLVSRGSEAIGMDNQQLNRFARRLRADAERAALPDRTALLRSATEKALNLDTGSLTGNAGWKRPTVAGGWLTWTRINPPDAATFGKRKLYHRVKPSSLPNLLATGSLMSTERRRTMGFKKGVGSSEYSDLKSGGASGVFLRISTSSGGPSGVSLVWDQPHKLLSNTDWYAYDGDHYGAKMHGTGYSAHGKTSAPEKVAKFAATNNEIIINNGLDLFGAGAPSQIKCGTTQNRNEILAQLKQQGVTTIGNRPIDKVITI